MKRFVLQWIASALFLISLPLTAGELYRSNSLGMALEQIPEVRRDEFQYVLERERSQGRTVERLFREGEELRRTERTAQNGREIIEVWSGGKLESRTEKSSGLPRTELTYMSDGHIVRREYAWDNTRLREVRIYHDGAMQEIQRYISDAQGRLLQHIIMAPDGTPLAVSGYQTALSSGFLESEWHQEKGRRYYRYDDSGDIELRSESEESDGGQSVTRFFRENGILRSRTVLPQGQGEVLRRFDEQRRVVEKITRGEQVVQREEYSYRDGRLARRVLRGSGEYREWRYEYDDQDVLRERLFYLNGVIRTRTVYAEGDEREVTVYQDGSAAVKIRYRGEEVLEKRTLEE